MDGRPVAPYNARLPGECGSLQGTIATTSVLMPNPLIAAGDQTLSGP